MIVLLGVASLVSLVAALVLGIRLLRLASRTRGAPELALGLGFLLGGFFGLLCILVGNPAAGSGMAPETGELLFRVGMTLLAIGVSCTYVFVWQTFRAGAPIARVVTAAAIVVIAVSLWPIWSQPVELAMVHPLYYVGDAARFAGMFWGCVEALGYHTTMRRRRALGLADPVVTNRFLLWGVAMAAGAGTIVTSTYMTLSGNVDPNAWPYLVLAVLTTISPVAQWLAFFPPRWYAARIGRQVATGA